MATTTRDPWLDNAKMLLITTVVVGHVLAILPGDDSFRDHLYAAIYFVHMPAFVLISGYLSQRFEWTRAGLTSLVTTLLVPFVIFTLLLHSMFYLRVGERTEAPMFLDPFWAMWFLAALLLWRVASPVLRASPAMIPLAFLVALSVPMFDQTPELALNRMLQFLPFFVVGLHLRREWLEWVKRPLARVLGVLALASLWLISAGFDERAETAWLFYNGSYSALGVDTAEGMLTRAGVFAVSFAGTAALLAVTPTGRGWWTTIGVQSMTVYLGHTIVVKALQYDGFFRDLEPAAATRQGLVVALVIVAVLAAPPVVRTLQWLTDPVGAARRLRADLTDRTEPPAAPTSAPRRDAETRRAPEPARG